MSLLHGIIILCVYTCVSLLSMKQQHHQIINATIVSVTLSPRQQKENIFIDVALDCFITWKIWDGENFQTTKLEGKKNNKEAPWIEPKTTSDK